MKQQDKKNSKDTHDVIGPRIRLRLSDHARYVLINDCDVFHCPISNIALLKDLRVNDRVINRVFHNYCRKAMSSINLRRIEEEQRLLRILRKPNLDADHIKDALLEDYTKKLVACRNTDLPETNPSFLINLSRDNLEYLSSEQGGCSEKKYYEESIPKYVRAVIEEYAQLPYIQRERIFYGDLVKDIEEAIDDENVLSITTQTDEQVFILPYTLQPDAAYLHHYLAGFRADSLAGPWYPHSLRLTSIKTCTDQKHGIFISEEETQKLANDITRFGIQYLSDSSKSEANKKILVQFTPKGERLYYKLLHNRPPYTAKLEDRIYEYRCSQMQAEFYFFRFGKDARILEPASLAKKLKKKHEDAAKQYR